MVAALPCGCELRREGAFDRLFGLGTLDRRRSRSVAALSAPRHSRSAGGRRLPGRSQRCEAREATCCIGHELTVFLNIQDHRGDTEHTEGNFLSKMKMHFLCALCVLSVSSLCPLCSLQICFKRVAK